MITLKSTFNTIFDVLKQNPITPEELSGRQRFIATMNADKIGLYKKTQMLFEKYRVLEEFCYSISEEENGEFWGLITMPQQLESMIANSSTTITIDKLKVSSRSILPTVIHEFTAYFDGAGDLRARVQSVH